MLYAVYLRNQIKVACASNQMLSPVDSCLHLCGAISKVKVKGDNQLYNGTSLHQQSKHSASAGFSCLPSTSDWRSNIPSPRKPYSRFDWMQIEDNAEPLAKEFSEEQLQPAAEYIAKNFEREARRLAKEVGPLAVGLPKAIRRAVQLNKVCLSTAL